MSSSSVKGPFSESGTGAELRSLYRPRPTRSLAMSKILFGAARNQANILRSFSRKLAIQVSLRHPSNPLNAHEHCYFNHNFDGFETPICPILNGEYREEKLPPCHESADDA